MAQTGSRHQIYAAMFAIATVFWIISTISCAEFGLLPQHNYTKGLNFHGARSATWDSSFQRAFSIPQEIYSSQRDNRNVEVTVEFRSLCEIMSRRVDLSDGEYEYRPPYYHEKICRTYGESERADAGNQMCMFSCVQRMDTVYITRRRYDTNCWETFTKTVASSCDCMWPETKYASIG